MRLAVAALLVELVVGTTPALGSATATPTLRVGTGPSLTIVGTGFAPRTLVTVRVTGFGIERHTARVRAGWRGGFTLRFTTLDRCEADHVTASTPSGVRVRVPTPWFVRECPPPPPLAPGIYAAD